jgi:hypothetical protein
MSAGRLTKSRSTLVGFHDLLGFGELLASSGGTLDSAVGEVAYRRILALRSSIIEVEKAFPDGTMFFHFNDTVTAYLDVEVQIQSSHTDPAGIAAIPVARSEYVKILQFISGCAALHQRSIAREEENRIGPAGRTFVVLGNRWDLGSLKSDRVFEVPPLQANLAFSEAYLADGAGSRAGFSHRSFDRLYVNDHVWFILSAATSTLTGEERSKLDALGSTNETFPLNLCSPDIKPISLEIFHRRRTFQSVMAQRAVDLARALAAPNKDE